LSGDRSAIGLYWTDQGTKDFRGAVERANSFGQLVEQAGGRVRELVWTLGEYDLSGRLLWARLL
jgi:uncharacterized protein with GYD domain